jgi:hypothetical protein
VGKFETAEIAVVKIRMRIKMNHANRFLFTNCAQDRQRTQMIAARRNGPDAFGHKFLEIVSNPHQGIIHICRIHRAVAEVCNIGEIVGNDTHGLVHPPHHGRLVAHLPRRMARTRAIGRASIPGNANKPNVNVLRLIEGHMG